MTRPLPEEIRYALQRHGWKRRVMPAFGGPDDHTGVYVPQHGAGSQCAIEMKGDRSGYVKLTLSDRFLRTMNHTVGQLLKQELEPAGYHMDEELIEDSFGTEVMVTKRWTNDEERQSIRISVGENGGVNLEFECW